MALTKDDFDSPKRATIKNNYCLMVQKNKFNKFHFSHAAVYTYSKFR